MKNSYLIIAAIIIAGAVIYTRTSSSAEILKTSEVKQKEESPKVGPSVVDGDYIRGNPNAPITIIEFSDFQCPFCAKFHPTLQQVLKNYPNDVKWVYRHFPLDSIHSEARPSAEASECAGEQGKFWEFADGLIENQAKLSKSLYSELAQNNGLNMGQFEKCVSSRKYKDKVEADLQEGVAAGVTGTPGSFINGELISGALPYANIEDVIKKILAE